MLILKGYEDRDPAHPPFTAAVHIFSFFLSLLPVSQDVRVVTIQIGNCVCTIELRINNAVVTKHTALIFRFYLIKSSRAKGAIYNE